MVYDPTEPHSHTLGPGEDETFVTIHDLDGLNETEIRQIINSEPGEPGQDGDPGPIGPEGPQGVPGTAGADGDTGLQGIPGATGPQGPAGEDGADGSAVTSFWQIGNIRPVLSQNINLDGWVGDGASINLYSSAISMPSGWNFLQVSVFGDILLAAAKAGGSQFAYELWINGSEVRSFVSARYEENEDASVSIVGELSSIAAGDGVHVEIRAILTSGNGAGFVAHRYTNLLVIMERTS